MPRFRAFVPAVLAAAALLLLTAANASATTYCVGNPPSPPPCDVNETLGVQKALDDAAAHPGEDRVDLGAGSFSGPFSYSGTGSHNTVVINGAGTGMTTLTSPGMTTGETVLTVSGEPGSVVAGLAIDIPAQDSDVGLSLGPGASAHDVNVTDQPGTTNSTGVQLDGAAFTGLTPAHKASIQMQEGVSSGGGGGSTAVIAGGTSVVADVSIGGGVNHGIIATKISGPVDLTLQRASVTALTPLFINSGASADTAVEAEDSVLRSTASAGNPGVVDVWNPGDSNVSFTGTHLTIEGGGPGAVGVQVTQFDSTQTGATASATVSDSIIGQTSAGPGHPMDVQGAGPATAQDANRTTGTLRYSDAKTSQDTSSPGNSTLTDTSHNIDQDPRCANPPASDYHLQSGSPAIDAASSTLSGSSGNDLDGNDRTVNGGSGTTCPNSGDAEPCPDMGAFERQPASGGAPVLAHIESNPLDYTAGTAPAAVTGALAVGGGSGTISGATVKIAAGFSQDDNLALEPQNGITGSFGTGSGTLTLSGTASVGDYQAALRSVTFSDANTTNPSTAARKVTFQVADGPHSSNTVSRAVNVVAPPAPPVSASSGQPPARFFSAAPAFQPILYVDLMGFTNPGQPPFPAPLTGPSIPQGVLTTGQEIFRGSAVTGTPACYGDNVATCEIQVNGPVNPPKGVLQTVLQSGTQRLPTDFNGEYLVLPHAVSTGGEGYAPNPWRYEVGDPPSPAQLAAALSKSLANLAPILPRSALVSFSGAQCEPIGPLPKGCFRTLTGPSGPLVTIGGDGSIIAAGGRNIIAAGGGNLTDAQIADIVSAGGGNIVAAGGGNIARILDAQGDVIGIIAAGGGNLRIIAAGGGNVIVQAGGQIVSSGSHNIVAAGADNIVSAGGGNIRDLGGGEIIAAGGGNLLPKNGFSFEGAAAGLATKISGDIGSYGFNLGTFSSSKAFGAAVGRHHATGTTIATGAVTVAQRGSATLVLRLTGRGRRLVAADAKRNAAAARRHRRPAKLALAVRETYASTYAKPVTVTRTIRVAPRVVHKRRRVRTHG